MNLENTPSPPSQEKQTSSEPSNIALSSSPTSSEVVETEEFMTAPLEGLCQQPLHLMTEEQMREWVTRIQMLRTSHQTYRAAMTKQKSEKKEPSNEVLSEFVVEPPKKKKILDDFVL